MARGSVNGRVTQVIEGCDADARLRARILDGGPDPIPTHTVAAAAPAATEKGAAATATARSSSREFARRRLQNQRAMPTHPPDRRCHRCRRPQRGHRTDTSNNSAIRLAQAASRPVPPASIRPQKLSTALVDPASARRRRNSGSLGTILRWRAPRFSRHQRFVARREPTHQIRSPTHRAPVAGAGQQPR